MEKNAKAAILEAIKTYIRDTKKHPSTVWIDSDVAYDLMKLGRDELGDMVERFVTQGLKALENRKLWGVTISVDKSIKGIKCE